MKIVNVTVNVVNRIVEVQTFPYADLSNYLNKQEVVSLIQEYNRTPIPVPTIEPLIINWRADKVPNDRYDRTYFARYGNIIRGVAGFRVELDLMVNYTPNVAYTMDGINIDVVTITELFPGQISIL